MMSWYVYTENKSTGNPIENVLQLEKKKKAEKKCHVMEYKLCIKQYL